MDKDKKEAPHFLLKVIKPKLRPKGNPAQDLQKGTGIQR